MFVPLKQSSLSVQEEDSIPVRNDIRRTCKAGWNISKPQSTRSVPRETSEWDVFPIQIFGGFFSAKKAGWDSLSQTVWRELSLS